MPGSAFGHRQRKNNQRFMRGLCAPPGDALSALYAEEAEIPTASGQCKAKAALKCCKERRSSRELPRFYVKGGRAWRFILAKEKNGSHA